MEKLGIVVAGLLLFAGCTIETGFDPLGPELSVEGAWTLNGGPADPVTCAGLGIDTVQVVFIDNGVDYFYEDIFEAPCEQGFFDTRPDLVLERGIYTTEWRAYDIAGFEVAQGGQLPLSVAGASVGDHVVLAPVDFAGIAVPPLIAGEVP